MTFKQKHKSFKCNYNENDEISFEDNFGFLEISIKFFNQDYPFGVALSPEDERDLYNFLKERNENL